MTVLDRLISDLRDRIDALTAQLRDGDIDIDTWQVRFSEDLTAHHIAAYLADKPGGVYGRDDRRILARVVGAEVDYSNAFADVIDDAWAEDDTVWKAGWESRARMYAGAVRNSYERGKTVGLPLPFYPTETQCLGNCGCSWRIDVLNEEEGTIDAYWTRAKDDSCDTCVAREANNPYEIREGVLT